MKIESLQRGKCMLRGFKKILGFAVHAADGEIGKIIDFYFDDHTWEVLYVIVEMGNWLTKKDSLICRELLGPSGLSSIAADSTVNQIENSPQFDDLNTLSIEQELKLHNYYNVPHKRNTAEAILHKVSDFIDFRVLTNEGEIGHIDDIFIDDENWDMRLIVLETGTWFSEKKILIIPSLVQSIDWDLLKVELAISKEIVMKAPPFDPSIPITSEFESNLLNYIGKKNKYR